MSLNFKLSFDQIDFIDEDFLIRIQSKQRKERKSCGTLEELIETITQNNIQFGNIIFYNFNIPAIKKKLKERNL